MLCPVVNGNVHAGNHGNCEAKGPKEKQEALTQYLTSLVGTTNNKAGLPYWISALWSVDDLAKLHTLPVLLFCLAVQKLGTNKSSDEDAIIGELFKELDDTNLKIICLLFRAKLLNAGGSEAEWEFHAVRLLERLIGTLRIDKLRPLGIIPSFYKLED